MDILNNSIFRFIFGVLIVAFISGILPVIYIIFSDPSYNRKDATYYLRECYEFDNKCYEYNQAVEPQGAKDCCIDYRVREIPIMTKIIDDFKLYFIIGGLGLGLFLGGALVDSKKKNNQIN